MSDIKVGVGNFSIVLNEEIMHRLDILKESQYMKEELGKIIDAIIEVYNGIEIYGDIIPSADCMKMISTIHEVQKDYAFLSTLIIDQQTVLDEKENSD